MDKYVTVVGGLGLFLLGIHHLTEGLKGLAGDSLRRALRAMVGGRLSAIVSGALFTVLIQSSTATTLTVIGVSAGLVTLRAVRWGNYWRDFRHDLDTMAGSDIRVSPADICVCSADARLWCLSLDYCQGQNAFGRGDPGWVRTALHRHRLPADGNGRGFVEPRCHRRKRFRLAMDPRWSRDLDVGGDAEFECRRGGDARGRACAVVDL